MKRAFLGLTGFHLSARIVAGGTTLLHFANEPVHICQTPTQAKFLFSSDNCACRTQLRYPNLCCSACAEGPVERAVQTHTPRPLSRIPTCTRRKREVVQAFARVPCCRYACGFHVRCHLSIVLLHHIRACAAAAKEGDQGKAALPYRFIFYLHQAGAQQPPAANSASATSEIAPDGLQKVSLTLPPPARRDFAQPDQLPAATQASISKLLSACGLQR